MSSGTESPPIEVIIGLDVGTTSTKVVGFGLRSAWRHIVVRESTTLQPVTGWQVQDPDAIIAGVLDALAECVTHAGDAKVAAISVSAAMHGLIGLDANLQPLTPLITWADARSRDEARMLCDTGRATALHSRSGTPVHPMSPLTKLMWFSRNEPDLCNQIRWWVGLKDYILWSLTGTLATELSSASGTGMLDLERRQWSPVAMDLAKVSPDQLPPILATTTALGLSRNAGGRVGLPNGTPVVVGAGDGPLGNLGTGALTPGVAGLSLGTSGAVRVVVPKPVVDSDGRLFCYALTEDHWVLGGAVSNGGAVVRWAQGVFASDLKTADSAAADAELLELGANVPAGSDGLLMLPYLLAERSPLWDPDLRGAFLGLNHSHTRGHFVRAAVEGVALQLSAVVDQLNRIEPVTSVRATGGVFRSELWRQVVAAALARPFQVTGGADGSALGAAALGLYGLGRARTLQAALRLLTPSEDHFAPIETSPADRAVYDRMRTRVPELLRSYDQVALLFQAVTPNG